jgi:V/A-type H+-transporting ATPase subunit A
MFPIAEGGTACIPGPFGSGKTVFQQAVSKYGNADIVLIAACGERAGEVVETLREFPTIIDPKTKKSLMERTIIICNTSSMPVASREASVYTAITISEYYRHMGLRVLVLADSTSRWAQALREMSGRLEEIPGEEAFPAYLSSLISSFYERAGLVNILDKNLGIRKGSVTIIGTVSPAGGNFEEPVTQSTLAVVGCFWGLTYARSYAKRFPAISPSDSWSRYMNIMKNKLNEKYYPNFVEDSQWLLKYYLQGQAIGNQMKVVGEEDLSLEDYVHYQKSEFFDAAILQQNSFDDVDAGPGIKRTVETLKLSINIIKEKFLFASKSEALKTIMKITSLFRDLNITPENTEEYTKTSKKILKILTNSEGK